MFIAGYYITLGVLVCIQMMLLFSVITKNAQDILQRKRKDYVKLEQHIDMSKISCNQLFQLHDGRRVKMGIFYFAFRMLSNEYHILNFITRNTFFSMAICYL